MKKPIATFLLVCLLLPMLLFAFNTTEKVWDIMFPKQVAQASTDRTTPYGNSFLQHYFYNLRSNLSENHSTCGYVAIGMLLSYYDTFWDDDIVPEVYETTAAISSLSDYDYNSPGAGEISHSLENCGSISQNIYDHLINAHSGTILQGTLLEIAYLLHDELNFEYDEQGDLIINKLVPWQAETIANQFLLNNRPSGSTENKLSISSSYTDLSVLSAEQRNEANLDTREHIISYVQDNVPIAVFYGTLDKSWGHVAIAYDYDPINDMLYFHYGSQGSYFESETQLGLNNGEAGKFYYGVLRFSTNSEHNHSNNFVLDSGESVCSCQLADHEHKYSYATYSVDQHKKFCHCGYETLQNHVYRLNGLKYICQYCKRIHTGTTPPITPVTPPTSIEDGDDTTDWLGVDVVNMEVPYYEE